MYFNISLMSKLKASVIITKAKTRGDDILRKVRFLAPAQSATIAPPIGPILGQFGINIMEFCKQFNDRSKHIEPDVLVFVDLILYRNKSFVFTIRTSPISFLVNEENLEIEDGDVPLFVDLSSMYKMLKIKALDSSVSELVLMRCFFGTMRSMHLQICNDLYKEI
jgi:large subunit ribosomal protein L11